MVFKILVRSEGSTMTFWALSNFSSPLSAILRPLSCRIRSSVSSAIRSMMFSLRASVSVTETLSRMACSTHFWFRPRFSATLLAWATISLITFSDIFPLISLPPAPTGWAAPMFVPGAITATSAAIVIITPAEAARAPRGATKTTIGTLLPRMSLMINRMDSARPPGVSNSIIRQAASSFSARSMLLFIYSAIPGLMASLMTTI